MGKLYLCNASSPVFINIFLWHLVVRWGLRFGHILSWIVSVEYDNWISKRTFSVLGGTASYWFAHSRDTDFASPISVILRDLRVFPEDGGGSFVRNVGTMCKITWRYISEYRLSYLRILCWKVSIVWGNWICKTFRNLAVLPLPSITVYQ
jgi:hypothetical protein